MYSNVMFLRNRNHFVLRKGNNSNFKTLLESSRKLANGLLENKILFIVRKYTYKIDVLELIRL